MTAHDYFFEFSLTSRNTSINITSLTKNIFDGEICQRIVISLTGQQHAKKWGCAFMETSAKTNLNVKEMFQVQYSKTWKLLY